MTSSLGSQIKLFVEQMMVSARIISPRFTDYKIESIGYYSEPADFDSVIKAEVERIMKDAGFGKKKVSAKSEEDKGFDPMALLRLGIGGQSAIIGQVSKILPPVIIAMLVKQIGELVLEELTKPGGGLDTRYKRRITNEIENYLSRQTQRDTQIGLRQVVIQAQNRFLNNNGNGSSNTFAQIRDGGTRVSEVGLHVKDRAKGLERYQ